MKIPFKLCEVLKVHKWTYTSRNHALVSRKCVRCGINAIDYRNFKKQKALKRK